MDSKVFAQNFMKVGDTSSSEQMDDCACCAVLGSSQSLMKVRELLCRNSEGHTSDNHGEKCPGDRAIPAVNHTLPGNDQANVGEPFLSTVFKLYT